jgi:predicted ATP-dependent protease
MTGSVNQRGRVQVIGGVSEKVEGFFDVGKARGLTGEQGVLIPAANVVNLILRQDVLDAIDAGSFRIYAVEAVDQAIEILTGVAAGETDADGTYPPASINGKVQTRLRAFAELRRDFGRSDGEEKRNGASRPPAVPAPPPVPGS